MKSVFLLDSEILILNSRFYRIGSSRAPELVKTVSMIRAPLISWPSRNTLFHSAIALIGTWMSPAVIAQKLLVTNAQLITVKAGEDCFRGYMLVGDDGKIAAIGKGEAPSGLAAAHVLDARGNFVAPGFISAHSHLFQSAFRGIGTDQTLYGWLKALRVVTQYATADDMYWFCLHGSVDFLRNGITTAYDFTYAGDLSVRPNAPMAGQGTVSPFDPVPFEKAQIKAKLESGIRFVDSVSIVWRGNEEETRRGFEAVLAFAKQFGDNPRFLKMAISGWVQIADSIDAAYREAKYMKDYHLINQAHFLESPEHVPEQQAKFAWYQKSGALGTDFIFGHFIQTTPDIVQTTAAAGASMCWQPTSNGRLGSGFADILAYRAAGIKIGVGLDDQSCTDISDPFQNCRIGLYAVRAAHKDATALTVRDMLYFHTMGSATILGVQDKVGSLEVGKFADFLVVDPHSPDTGPIHDAVSTYVLACGLRNLKQVYVGGELVADGLALPHQDEKQIDQEVETRMSRLQQLADNAQKKTETR